MIMQMQDCYELSNVFLKVYTTSTIIISDHNDVQNEPHIISVDYNNCNNQPCTQRKLF